MFDQPREFGYWLSIYRDYQKGILPEAGARLEQSAYVLDMMSLMAGIYGEVQESMEEEANRPKGRPEGMMHSRE